MKDYDMTGKRVLVVGLGKSGIAAMQALLKAGADVSVQDMKDELDIDPNLIRFFKSRGVTYYIGKEPDPDARFDMLVLSPGVSPELGFVQRAKENGAEITGELELAYRMCSAKFVSITGTNGKTTTTTLVGEIFRNARRKTYVVGNIGVAVLSLALTAEPDAWMITETSSFQLETTRFFKPEVSAILNLTPDHLNRHHTMEAYGAAKAKTFANQDEDQYCVLNYDDEACFALGADCNAKIVPFSRKEELKFGAFVKDGVIVIKDENGKLTKFCRADELIIPGAHNLENALAACAVAFFAGIDPADITETLTTFAGVEHRLEYVAMIDGVRYVNDSKGTNPDAAIKAVEAMPPGIILIAGGYDKGTPFDAFVASFEGKVKKLLLLGVTAEQIAKCADNAGFKDYEFVKDMDTAVSRAHETAEAGDVVLLSPACASWDMYTSYEQRGEHFKELVAGLER